MYGERTLPKTGGINIKLTGSDFNLLRSQQFRGAVTRASHNSMSLLMRDPNVGFARVHHPRRIDPRE